MYLSIYFMSKVSVYYDVLKGLAQRVVVAKFEDNPFQNKNEKCRTTHMPPLTLTFDLVTPKSIGVIHLS